MNQYFSLRIEPRRIWVDVFDNLLSCNIFSKLFNQFMGSEYGPSDLRVSMRGHVPESPGGREPRCTGSEEKLADCEWKHPVHHTERQERPGRRASAMTSAGESVWSAARRNHRCLSSSLFMNLTSFNQSSRISTSQFRCSSRKVGTRSGPE